MSGRPLALDEIVTAGLCIGCGLCESLAGKDRVELGMTERGVERPFVKAPLDDDMLRAINGVCPGVVVPGADPDQVPAEAEHDLVMGPSAGMVIAHATDPEVRHRGATGGVLTALGQFVLESGRVETVLHVAARPDRPMRTAARISTTADDVQAEAGSRYGPAAPLTEVHRLLGEGRRFAFIGKPCDVGALRNLARTDPRVNDLVPYMLVMICGGSPELRKSADLLDLVDVRESDLSLFRYRGHGNPGPIRIETRDGRAEELGYLDMWEDTTAWRLQSRCKLCPDAIGESADLAAYDVWPGGAPLGEDAGFNGILRRTKAGQELFEAAVEAGVLTVLRPSTMAELHDYQPHEVKLNKAVWARYAGMRAKGLPTPTTPGLRIEEIARTVPRAALMAEARGTRARIDVGRIGEPVPAPEAGGETVDGVAR